MSSSAPDVQVGTLSPSGLRRVVIILSLTEITSWGVLYYAFPVLAPAIAADTGWSLPALIAAFSASQIASAICGLGVGRIIDRYGPRTIMTAGSVLSIPAIVTIAMAPAYPMFFAGWILAGAAMSALLYPPAFAALTHWGGARRVKALTALTLVGGLASTVFAPLTVVVNQQVDWRQTYLILLVVLAAITIPAHWFGLRQPWHNEHREVHRRGGPVPVNHRVWRSRPFILLALSMSLTAFCIYAVVINLIPMLIARDFTPAQAALALGLSGAGQVVGRLGYAQFAAHTSTTVRTVIVFASVALSTALLAVLSEPMLLVIAVSVLFGLCRGVFTLTQATAVSDRWGTAGFGRLNGIIYAPVLFVSALAPLGGALLAEATGSHTNAFLLLSACAASAAILCVAATPARTTDGREGSADTAAGVPITPGPSASKSGPH